MIHCPLCTSTKVASKNALSVHIASKHSNCFNCKLTKNWQRMTLSEKKLLEHLSACHDLQTACRFCNYRSMSYRNIKRHETSSHHACANCAKLMDSAEELMAHQNEECFSKVPMHLKVEKCDKCDMTFIGTVKQHEISIHHACVNCDRSMDSIEKLFEHQNGECFSKIGLSYRLKKCDICEKILLAFRMRTYTCKALFSTREEIQMWWMWCDLPNTKQYVTSPEKSLRKNFLLRMFFRELQQKSNFQAFKIGTQGTILW